jgi:hypothetical protein
MVDLICKAAANFERAIAAPAIHDNDFVNPGYRLKRLPDIVLFIARDHSGGYRLHGVRFYQKMVIGAV